MGTFLLCTQDIESMMHTTLSAIIAEQTELTEVMLKKNRQKFLDFAGTWEEAIMTYQASKMFLAVHSNDSYLSKSNKRSRKGRHFFMSSNVIFPPTMESHAKFK